MRLFDAAAASAASASVAYGKPREPSAPDEWAVGEANTPKASERMHGSEPAAEAGSELGRHSPLQACCPPGHAIAGEPASATEPASVPVATEPSSPAMDASSSALSAEPSSVPLV